MSKKISIIIVMTLLFVTGCRSGDSKYSRVILKDYKTSLKYKNYEEKKKETNPQYYKIKSFNRFWKEELFFVVEDDNEKKEVNLLLSIKYRSKDWVYMSKIEFISNDIYENYTIDFEKKKFQSPIWKDNTTLFMGVEERIAFRLTEDQINQIEKYINAVDLKIKLYSDYDGRTYTRDVRAKERRLMKKVLNLYKTMSKKYEKKSINDSSTKKESA